jgi:hypothetical protein
MFAPDTHGVVQSVLERITVLDAARSDRVAHAVADDEPQTMVPAMGFWPSLRRLWCRHERIVQTERTLAMPAHVVCLACGWREPVPVARPIATRTWDSTRDAARYAWQKQRRRTADIKKPRRARRRRSVETAAPATRSAPSAQGYDVVQEGL